MLILTNGAFLYPIHVSWQTVIDATSKRYYAQVLEGNKDHKLLPGFRSYVENEFSDIESSSSKAITSLYQKLNPLSNTKFIYLIISP